MKARTELTAREMEMALRLFKGESMKSIAATLGVHENTVKLRMRTPQALAYKAQLRVQKSEEQIPLHSPPVELARPVISFTRDDAAAIYLEVCRNKEVTDANKIRAADSLVELFRLKEQSVVPVEGEAKPAEPDVFQPTWMQ
jgi:hypothetical protein